jgi:hypothetical protein
LSASPTIVDCAAPDLSCERYGLHLVEEPAPLQKVLRARAEPSFVQALRPFHWSLLAGFAALELAYLHAVVVFAHRAVRWVIGG